MMPRSGTVQPEAADDFIFSVFFFAPLPTVRARSSGSAHPLRVLLQQHRGGDDDSPAYALAITRNVVLSTS
jgi:hypothetical protein